MIEEENEGEEEEEEEEKEDDEDNDDNDDDTTTMEEEEDYHWCVYGWECKLSQQEREEKDNEEKEGYMVGNEDEGFCDRCGETKNDDLEQAEEEEEEETEEEDDDSEEDEETVAINGGEYSRKRKMTRGENFQDLIVVLIHRVAYVCVLLVFMICYYVLLFYFKDSIHT